MSNISILNVAEYIISKRKNKQMSRLMIQSAAYFVQCEYIKREGIPLFRENFIKKGLFPLSVVLDAAFSQTNILEYQDVAEFKKRFNVKQKSVLDEIISEFDRTTSHKVIMRIAEDKAWLHTREDKVITVKMIKQYCQRE